MSTERYSPWKTAITDSQHEIRVRGYRLEDLIDRVDFVSMIALVLRGELATPAEARLLNAFFVAICDHGIVPSSAVARIVASCGVPIQSAIAAAISTIGDDHGGACEQLAMILQERTGLDSDDAIAAEAREIVADHRARKARVPGYGHALHRDGDPRAVQLLKVAKDVGVGGQNVRRAAAIGVEIERQLGRRIPINTDGAIAALASDMGFHWTLMRPLIIVSRSVGLAAHASEQMRSGEGWRLAARPSDIAYVGHPPRELDTADREGR
jgi:citrate synthase